MKIVFATRNTHKIKEVSQLIPPTITLQNLNDIGCDDELPETGQTLFSNAKQKARYVHDKFGVNCFADDSGLEVSALDGRPGVYSARFAGPNADSASNNVKLLTELKGVKNRTAVFRTVIALIIDNQEQLFEGSIKGVIAEHPSGENGFGYDPLFIPDGFEISFAEMSEEQKNSLSHRAMAIKKLVEYLNGI